MLDAITEDRDSLLGSVKQHEESALRSIDDAEKDVLARLTKLREEIKTSSSGMILQIETAYGKSDKPIIADVFEVVKDDDTTS